MSAVMQPRPAARPMTVRDLDAVVAIEQRAYSHPWSRGNFTDSLAAGYLAELWFDEAEGEVLGYLVAMAGVDELHLLNITVAPEHQGRGLGRQMMATLQAHARAQRAATLWLEVRASNLRAQALYRSLGFVQVGLRRGYYPALQRREDAVVMSLALAAAEGPPGDAHAVD